MAGFVNLLALLISADGAGTTQNTTQQAINTLANATSAAINGVTGGRGLSQILAQSAVPASVTGTTSETVLATIPIPAGAMGVNGGLRVSFGYTQTNNANSKTIRVRLGATSALLLALTTQPTVTFDFLIVNRGVTNSQVSTINNNNVLSWGGTSGGAFNTLAIDTTVAQNLTIAATLANAADTVTLETLSVQLLNP